MKKRVMTLLMASVMMVTLMGCDGVDDIKEFVDTTINSGDETSADETSAEETVDEGGAEESALVDEASASFSGDDASFEYNGKTISFTDDVQTIIDGLGTPDSMEADHPGYIYTFASDGIVFFTDEVDMVEIPEQLTIDIEDVKTARGIGVGSTIEELKAAYGNPDSEIMEGSHMLSYEFDNCSISFAADEKVISLTYFKKV